MKRLSIIKLAGLLTGLALFAANYAGAQNLPAPVSGLQILDLAGNPINTATNTWTSSFVASSANSTVTFVFRHDPGFFTFNNASVADSSTPLTNLLLNGDFTAVPLGGYTPGGGAPNWSYFIQAGNLFPQFLGYELPSGGWFDGATQAYDGIDQTFATTIGDTYNVSFTLQSDTSGGVYQQTSTNGNTTNTGGNGIDVVVYAGNGLPPTTVPDEASTCLLLLVGVAGLVALKRRHA